MSWHLTCNYADIFTYSTSILILLVLLAGASKHELALFSIQPPGWFILVSLACKARLGGNRRGFGTCTSRYILQ